MSEFNPVNLLEIAKEATIKAGQFLKNIHPNHQRVDQNMPHDIKIEADRQSEQIIIDFLKSKSPYSILSEERGFIQRSNDDYQWIVDPLDGSLNYFRNIPFSCTSVGLWQNLTPVLGAVYDFQRSELFFGLANDKTYLGDSAISVSAINSISQAVLCSGFPSQADLSTQAVQGFIRCVQNFKKVRFLGSAALSVAYVACGRADAYYENDIMIWDIAGAVPVVLGAGGKIKLEETVTPHRYCVYISNGRIDIELIHKRVN